MVTNKSFALSAKLTDAQSDAIVHNRKSDNRRRRFDDDDIDHVDAMDSDDSGSRASRRTPTVAGPAKEFSERLDEALENVRAVIDADMEREKWGIDDLDKEKTADGSCWKYKDELESAIQRIAENLIEREEESRLVVLGLVSKEHVLLLGPPGTGECSRLQPQMPFKWVTLTQEFI